MQFMPKALENLNLKRELLNGYNKGQIDKILNKISDEYETLYKENESLSREIAIMKEKVQHYRTIEESLQHTLIIAQHTSDTMKSNAAEKAASIIKEAESAAKRIVDDANLQVAKIYLEFEETKKNLQLYKMKSQTLLNSMLEMLKQPSPDDTK